MKRFLMLVSFAVVATAALSGCGGNGSTNCNPANYANGVLPAACYGQGGQPGFGQPGFGQPGYGQPGYGQPPFGGYPAQPPFPPPGGGFVYGPPPPPWFYPCGGNPYCYF